MIIERLKNNNKSMSRSKWSNFRRLSVRGLFKNSKEMKNSVRSRNNQSLRYWIILKYNWEQTNCKELRKQESLFCRNKWISWRGMKKNRDLWRSIIKFTMILRRPWTNQISRLNRGLLSIRFRKLWRMK